MFNATTGRTSSAVRQAAHALAFHRTLTGDTLCHATGNTVPSFQRFAG